MRALVTGASGFIGGHLARALRAAGYDVRCLVRATSNRAALEPLGVEFAVGDITDPASLVAATADVDAVFHLASLLKAPWMTAFHTVNIQGSANVAAACAAQPLPPTLVLASSLAAGGPVTPGDPPRREVDGASPVSIYGRVKRAAEEAATDHADRVPMTVVRPPMVFGEGDRSALALFRSVSRGIHLLPGLPGTCISMVHAQDLAAAMIAAAERGERVGTGAEGTGVYYVADALTPTWAEVGSLVAAALDRKPPRILRMPRALLWLVTAASELGGRIRRRPVFLNLDKYREARAGSWACDVGKATRELGLRTAPLDVRLRETARWYIDQGWIKSG